MATYRARVDQIRKSCIDKGIRPTGHALGLATGLPATTINAMFHGRPPSNRTIATIVGVLGGEVGDLFEIGDDEDDRDRTTATAARR